MLTFNDRLATVEASLTSTLSIVNGAFTDGTIDIKDDELGAVMDEVFDRIDLLIERSVAIKKQLTMIESYLDPATRI